MGSHITKRMAELGMTQSELVEKTKLSAGYISDLINGHRGTRIGGQVALKLAAALDVDPLFLLGGFANAKDSAPTRRWRVRSRETRQARRA